MTHRLKIEALGELELVMTRRFDAPRALVFDAWTKPELLKRWLGVHNGWTMAECEVDLRVGGAYRYVWSNGEVSMACGGIFRKVVVPELTVCTERFDDPWYPGEALITHVLTEERGVTTSTITMHYESTEARDAVLASPMETGLEAGFSALDELLRAKAV